MNNLKILAKNPMFWIALVYTLSPIDFIPDIVPFFGTVDDALIFVIASVIQVIRSNKN